jgi:RimJ/RimL family protein N-acetyltransferase
MNTKQRILGREGETITLRPTERSDLEDLVELWNDGRVMKWVGFPDGLGYDRAAVITWYERLPANPQRHHFVVVSNLLGFCGEAYYAVDAPHRRAGLDIKFRIAARGGGRATAALLALINRVFENEPEVDTVWTEPADNNLAARTLYWRCGLRPAQRPSDIAREPHLSYWELRREKRDTVSTDPGSP